LIIAALLLASRKITSRTMIATVGWPLLLLVAGLFGITGALNHVGVAAQILDFLTEHGLLPDSLLLLTSDSPSRVRQPAGCRARCYFWSCG